MRRGVRGRPTPGILSPEVVIRDQPLRVIEAVRQGVTIAGDARFGLLAALLERVLVLLEAARTEESAQQSLPLAVRGEQKPREAVLGQEDHLKELLLRERKDLVERLADIARTCRAALPPALNSSATSVGSSGPLWSLRRRFSPVS